MARYRIITLVDITNSKVDRSESDNIKIGQQSNFNSLVQTIGLRSNVFWENDPTKHTGRLPFELEGKAAHWIWEFDCEREDVFLKDNDPTYLLKEDLHGVPVISDLENTVDLTVPAFQTRNGHQNTWLTIITQ